MAVASNTLKEDLELMPTLSFWYGMGFEELVNLPNWVLRMYARDLDRLLATYEVILSRAATMPHLKKAAISSRVQDLNRRIRRGRRTRVVPKGRFDEAVRGVGIGVVHEPRKAS